jgi:predicted MPP superfamily phosphohydrolase
MMANFFSFTTLSYESVGFLLLALMLVTPGAVAFHLILSWFRKSPSPQLRRRPKSVVLTTCLIVGLIYLGLGIDAFLFEPYSPTVEYRILAAAIPKPLRVLHLSDLHIEGKRPRLENEEWLVSEIQRLSPDLILVTGDIHQMDVFEVQRLSPILSKIVAPMGVFACLGYDSRAVLREAAPQIRILEDDVRILETGEGRIAICGMNDISNLKRLSEGIPQCDYRIALNHTPDQIEPAASQGFDLYLCGHTHGGQVRVPFWGAVITLADTGKRFENGWYKVGRMQAHTSRGFGLEPLPAPQVRFLCRPEVTLIILEPHVRK